MTSGRRPRAARRFRPGVWLLVLSACCGAGLASAADLAAEIEAADDLLDADAAAALQAATALQRTAEDTGSAVQRFDATLLLARALDRTGDTVGAIEVAGRAIAIARDLDDAGRIADAHLRRARTHIDRNEYPEAEADLDAARRLATAITDRARQGEVFGQLARVRRYQVRYAEALEFNEQAIAAFEDEDDATGVNGRVAFRGVVLELMGQFEAALAAHTQALAFHREVDDRSGVATALYNIGEIHRELGDHERSLAYLEDALAIDQQVGDRLDIAYSHNMVGQAHYELGHLDLAREHVTRAVELFAALDARRDHAWAQSVLARVELAAGDHLRARALLEPALATALERDARSLAPIVRRHLVELELAEGNVAAALQHARLGVAMARDNGELEREESLVAMLALALEASGDLPGAVAALRRQRELREAITSESRAQSIAWMQSEAEFLRRGQRIELLEAERALQDARIDREQQLRLLVLVGAATLFLIFALAYGGLGERRLNRRLSGEVDARTAELEVALRARSDFIANISHEIRTPMNAVIGLTRLALGSSAEGERRDYLEKSQRAARTLLQLLNDVLDLSKLEAGMMRREDTPTSIAAVLGDVCNLEAGAGRVPLLQELDPAVPPLVQIDRIRLEQVLVNLVSNALKFTEVGQVTLRCQLAQRDGARVQLRFAVEDTGSGIAAADQERLFSAFEQADATTTRRFGGTGLGLAIARQIVELLGGELTLDSALGRGSCFAFTVEATVTEAAPASLRAPQALATAAPAPLSGLRLLVVDDVELNTLVATKQAERVGAEVASVDSGQACLEALARDRFDCVLMDVQMPGMDGIECTRRIRADARTRGLPVVAVSASVHADDVEAARTAGMNDFLPKPFEEADLVAVVLRNVDRTAA